MKKMSSEQMLKDIEDFEKSFFEKCVDKEFCRKFNWEKKLPFRNFFLHFVNYGISLTDDAFSKPIQERYLETLVTKIYNISFSTLRYLFEETYKKKYVYYNEVCLSDKKYIKKIFERYPCLVRIMQSMIRNITNQYLDLEWRLKKDHSKIVKNLCANREFSSILSMEEKRSVLIITLDNGCKIVYKPYSLKNEICYEMYLKFLSQNCQHPLKGYPIVDCGSYGWEGYAAKKECKNQKEIEKYDYRLGILLFADYLLNTNYLHLEKLISSENVKTILIGFQDAYNYVLENKEEARKQLRIFENLYVPYYVQENAHYETLLHISCHPIFLKDARDRELFLCSSFEHFNKTQGDFQVVKAEICDMLDMVIPYFYTNTSTSDLYTSKGHAIRNYFGKSGLQHVKEKMSALKTKDLSDQIKHLRNTFTKETNICEDIFDCRKRKLIMLK